MILTLTLNPAIDLALSTDRIIYDDRAYIEDEQLHPGGKGINAAQVIHSYGGEAHAVAPYGGRNGDCFLHLLKAWPIGSTLINVAGETRRNIAITDHQGLTVKLDQPGAGLSTAELQALEEAVAAQLPRAEWLLLTGSIGPNVDDSVYARLIRLAQQNNVPTLLDASGPPLRLGLAAKPSLAKPNRTEAERLLDRSLISQAETAKAVREIQALGAERVILSLGSQGAMAAWEEGVLRAIVPAVSSGCPIGAGDVLAASCALELSRGQSFPDALRFAVAAASVAASLPGLTFAPRDQARALTERVELRPI